MDPSNETYLFELGKIYFTDKEFKLAQKVYKKAVELKPDSAEIHTNLGLTLYEMGLFLQAEKEYKDALKIDKNFVLAYNGLGILYAKMKRFDEAATFWQEGLILDPENSDIKNNLKKLEEIESRREK